MEIFIHRDGQQHGPYTVEDIKGHLASGSIKPEELGWHEGLADWKPVGTLIANSPAPAFPTAPAPASAAPAAQDPKAEDESPGSKWKWWHFMLAGVGIIAYTVWRFVETHNLKGSSGIILGIICVALGWGMRPKPKK